MKNTRKKMLLSSVAMLLVALIALGSATFAWYYVNASVYAKDASFAAAKAEGLEITKEIGANVAWNTTGVDLKAATNLSPAATSFASAPAALIGGTGGRGTSYTNGTLVNDGGLLTLNDYAAIKTNTANFYYDDCYVASSGDACDAYLKVTGTGAADTYMVILVYVDNQLMGKYTSDTANGAPLTSTKVKEDTTDNTKAVIDGAIGDVTGLKVLGEDKIATAFTAKTKASNGTHVEVIAYADGYNAKCTSEKANPTGISLRLDFKNSAW